jgi:hypothetical protein
MKVIRRPAGYSLLEHRKDEGDLEELNTDSIEIKYNWLDHVRRMKDIRHRNEFLTIDPLENEDLSDH